MNEYQITFFVDDITGNSYIISPLRQLEKKFKSTIRIVNITRNRNADLSIPVAVLQVGLMKGDLCQITAVGIDAELACFVFKDIIAEHYVLIGSHINDRFSNQLIRRVPQISPPCKIKWYYVKAQTELNKEECLKGLAQLVYSGQSENLLFALMKREERSSTCVSQGIALPHVIFNNIDSLSIAVLTTDFPIDWSSKFGHVQLVITLILPAEPSKNQIVSATNLTRNLLNGQITERLRKTRNSADLQALLMYLSSRLLK
ncbi:PTS sugar transporter subunit IIA [Vibrio sp. TH_r3]|uniref:PTS sugar transporter subunit IIA n=1 Tax=Vibrio sp. TH_r3 TaxID=3082084 RepID=UPI002955CAD1|nr:PTS sugar transporter subunit IIA [Vibrio sp. TH_r3]MDV7105148.1 PTS sugar transporter subunit IIA [Vibrio sp. TH_r3]